MNSLYISPSQCRMARALLNWTQPELASRCGLNVQTISNFEKEKNKKQPDTSTLEKIASVFKKNGVVLTEHGGVEPARIRSYILDSYMELLDDISELMPEGGEVLKHCVDDRYSTPQVIEKINQMRNAGIRERLTISDDNEYITGNPEDYRQVPASYFSSSEVTIIYLDRVAFLINNKVLVIVDDKLSKVFRDQFNFWWKEGRTLDVS